MERVSTLSPIRIASWGTGSKISSAVKACMYMRVESGTRVNFWMARSMDEVYTTIAVGLSMMESGIKTVNTASDYILTPMAKNSKATG